MNYIGDAEFQVRTYRDAEGLMVRVAMEPHVAQGIADILRSVGLQREDSGWLDSADALEKALAEASK